MQTNINHENWECIFFNEYNVIFSISYTYQLLIVCIQNKKLEFHLLRSFFIPPSKIIFQTWWRDFSPTKLLMNIVFDILKKKKLITYYCLIFSQLHSKKYTLAMDLYMLFWDPWVSWNFQNFDIMKLLNIKSSI